MVFSDIYTNQPQTKYYDEQLNLINNLTWLPWIGKEVPHSKSNFRLLIIGESHYVNEVEGIEYSTRYEEVFKSKDYNRAVIKQCSVRGEWKNKTLANIERLLVGKTLDTKSKEALWQNLSYYNLIQRPMITNNGRPSFEDFILGWKVFIEVIKVLSPTHCLFIGVMASNSFNMVMAEQTIKHEPIKLLGKIGRCQPRKSSLTINDNTINCIFTKHAGKYFSHKKWHEFLKTENSELISELIKQSNINYN